MGLLVTCASSSPEREDLIFTLEHKQIYSGEGKLVQSLSHIWLFVTPWTTGRQASLSITYSQSSPKPMSIESGDAIQPSHPLTSPFPPALNHSQHQGLFKWVSFSHQVARVLEFQLQHQSFQWTPRTDLLLDGLVGSPFSPRGSQEYSPTPQFKGINSSALSFLHSPTLTSIQGPLLAK